MNPHPAVVLLLYGVVPLWLLTAPADWACHRKSGIERSSGVRESTLHLLLAAQAGLPLLAALFLEVNALILGLALALLLAHEVTAYCDTRYASSRRRIGPLEQHVHSLMEGLPIAAVLLLAVAYWPQWLALFGLGKEAADFSWQLKNSPLPAAYLATVAIVAACNALLYAEEWWRCWQKRGFSRPMA